MEEKNSCLELSRSSCPKSDPSFLPRSSDPLVSGRGIGAGLLTTSVSSFPVPPVIGSGGLCFFKFIILFFHSNTHSNISKKVTNNITAMVYVLCALRP
jgi:hypothetical protein